METIGLPKELYEKVTAICELDAAFKCGMRNLFDAEEKPYDLDVKQRLSALRKDIVKLLANDAYVDYVDAIHELLFDGEHSEMTRIHELHYRFYKLD